MKWTLIGACAASVCITCSLRADAPTPKPSEQVEAGHGDDKLEHLMESMSRTLKRLEKQAKDSSKLDASLKMIGELEQACLTAKSEIPGGVNKLAAEERTKAISDYRKMMGNVLQEFINLENAMIDRNEKKIDEAIQSLHDLRTSGHDDFKVKEHEH